VCDGIEIDAVLVGFGMKCPVPRLIAEFLGFDLENSGGGRFRDDQKTNDAKKSGLNESNPGSPSPAEIGLGNETANNRTGDRAAESETVDRIGRGNSPSESTGCEGTDAVCPFDRLPNICHRSADHS
jgi:hypothetical protein